MTTSYVSSTLPCGKIACSHCSNLLNTDLCLSARGYSTSSTVHCKFVVWEQFDDATVKESDIFLW